jgi:non-ribosomal peptide synthetase component F
MGTELAALRVDHGGPVDWPFEPFPEATLDGSIIDRFDAIAARYSERLAVGDESRSLSYSEFSCLVDRIAAAVACATGDRSGPVAILLRNEARYPAAMLGVLASGRAFVPLESDYPIGRNLVIAAHAKAVALIFAEDLAVNADALFAQDLAVLNIDRLAEDWPSARPRRPTADDLAYIIYIDVFRRACSPQAPGRGIRLQAVNLPAASAFVNPDSAHHGPRREAGGASNHSP